MEGVGFKGLGIVVQGRRSYRMGGLGCRASWFWVEQKTGWRVVGFLGFGF